MKIYRLFLLVASTLLCASCAHTVSATPNMELDRQAVDRFMNNLVQSHNFKRHELELMFSQARYLQPVIDAITRPSEILPWYQYKRIFLTEDRISGGVNYWRHHAGVLSRAKDQFGVPPEIIVAIIGIETHYGNNTGDYRVIDSLSTLAFHYPKRAKFFRSELEQFMLLAREQEVSPLDITGSYAGAMGVPQFIASSYRNYAIDFDGDNYINLWSNHQDAIGSVANYFSRHGWTSGAPVIYRVSNMPEEAKALVQDNPKPKIAYGSLEQAGVSLSRQLASRTPVALLEFEEREGAAYWVAMNNFYVITRYNHSQLYALAAYLLSQKILERYKAS